MIGQLDVPSSLIFAVLLTMMTLSVTRAVWTAERADRAAYLQREQQKEDEEAQMTVMTTPSLQRRRAKRQDKDGRESTPTLAPVIRGKMRNLNSPPRSRVDCVPHAASKKAVLLGVIHVAVIGLAAWVTHNLVRTKVIEKRNFEMNIAAKCAAVASTRMRSRVSLSSRLVSSLSHHALALRHHTRVGPSIDTLLSALCMFTTLALAAAILLSFLHKRCELVRPRRSCANLYLPES